MPHRILIADDDPQVIAALKLLFKSEKIICEAVTTTAALEASLRKEAFDVILMDLNYALDTTSGKEGLDLIPRLKLIEPDIPIIVMTGWATVEIAVEALKSGAADFIRKPWENERLLSIITTQIKLSRLSASTRRMRQENNFLRKGQAGALAPAIIATSSAMKQTIETLRQLSRSDMNILLTGENGTGKSLLAQFVHDHSLRKHEAFIEVNMGAVPEHLFESEMFGHVKGAFTDAKVDRIGRFEMAEGGTLFLDEIGNIPLQQQQKLLRVLESKQFEKVGSSRTRETNARIISATNANLAKLIDDGLFRQDLLYRLNTAEVAIPPLRQRIDDIVALAEHFLQVHAARYHRELPRLTRDARQQLQLYHWPGNVRELSHVVERSLFISDRSTIDGSDLAISDPRSQLAKEKISDHRGMTLAEIEEQILQQRLDMYRGRTAEAAKSLGLSRSAFYRRLEKYGL